MPRAPQRIVCLCPSLTETLVALGLQQQLVGRTRYCIHPKDQLSQVAEVGGTKKLDFDALGALQPDLIIAEKEENRLEDVEAMSQHWPVYVCEIRSVEEAIASIRRLGELTQRDERAKDLSSEIESAWLTLPQAKPPLRVLYLIWRKPWMAAGRDTYIDTVLQRLGFENAAAELDGRYPQLEPANWEKLDVDLCLLSSEPFPFEQKHIEELAVLLPKARSQLTDGEMFSWYGSRMLPAAEYLTSLVKALTKHS